MEKRLHLRAVGSELVLFLRCSKAVRGVPAGTRFLAICFQVDWCGVVLFFFT
ncbi:MAG: hypothetical protein LBL39_08325 [Planctomycetaceae bacterium]|jgi:hypothetical protein|nr:hypothetical protein [Planctomycetaceae bacterium]